MLALLLYAQSSDRKDIFISVRECVLLPDRAVVLVLRVEIPVQETRGRLQAQVEDLN